MIHLPSNGVPLSAVVEALGLAQDVPSVQVRGVHHDSRKVVPGSLFVARRGEASDGRAFIEQAVQQGAVAILADLAAPPSPCSVPVLLVSDIRLAIGRAATVVYGDATKSLKLVGITGTNGKTTTSHLVRAAIDGCGGRCAVLGTLGGEFLDHRYPTAHTTPEGDELARVARDILDHGASHLVMEVSSHALEQRRVDAMTFAVAAFTNLTQDHLDYHKTLDAYASAKSRLFYELSPARSVVSIDDSLGRALADGLRESALTVSCDPSTKAHIRPILPARFDADSISAQVLTPTGVVHLDAPFVGHHNLANLLLTLGIVSSLQLPLDAATHALASCSPVPGRLERCHTLNDDIAVYVDYAHTPDALERALSTLRTTTRGRLVCVFGCGGDRDTAKRPLMGEVVARLADVAIVTNDNPRSESPELIADAILMGMQGGGAPVEVELDRRVAIEHAILSCRPGDTVLVAGKGHETYQVIGKTRLEFDDRVTSKQALAMRSASTGGE